MPMFSKLRKAINAWRFSAKVQLQAVVVGLWWAGEGEHMDMLTKHFHIIKPIYVSRLPPDIVVFVFVDHPVVNACVGRALQAIFNGDALSGLKVGVNYLPLTMIFDKKNKVFSHPENDFLTGVLSKLRAASAENSRCEFEKS